MVNVTVDWLKIKTEYINGNISLRKLAQKSGTSYSQLAKVAAAEKWKDLREAQRIKIESKTNQRITEKISDSISDEAAAKVRIREKLIKMAENWVDAQLETVSDTNDFRRMVQSCIDLGVMDVQDASGLDDDGLLRALGENAENIFAFGDDSEMVSEDDA